VTEDSPRKGPRFRRKIFLLGMACLFLVMVVTSVFGKKGVMDIHRARLRLADLELEALKLRQDKARLEAEIRELETNPRAVEKKARGELWLIKPGEKVVVVPKDPKK
jgi:cell division protein FtsB